MHARTLGCVGGGDREVWVVHVWAVQCVHVRCAAHLQVHCAAEQPMSAILRFVVCDEGQGGREVAFETVVMGVLRPGYRSIPLRACESGTKIEQCALLVHVTLGTEELLAAGGAAINMP